jgi:DNA ligase-1
LLGWRISGNDAGVINESAMTLATRWTGQNVRGWIASEKFDGCRAYWDGAALWTRSGRKIEAPEWFTAPLPAGIPLDGEIWAGRGGFYDARNAVNHGQFDSATKFVVFDAPDAAGNWTERMAYARGLVDSPHVGFANGVVVKGDAHLGELFDAVFGVGGEGLMLRHPRAGYVRGRTEKLLKVKRDN